MSEGEDEEGRRGAGVRLPFNADSARPPTTQFVFQKFGQEGGREKEEEEKEKTPDAGERGGAARAGKRYGEYGVGGAEETGLAAGWGSSSSHEPPLTTQLPSRCGDVELKITAQPESNHRARYLTEGSRGAVKDRAQKGHPAVKLFGYSKPAKLQVFVGSDAAKVRPHGYYQACEVQGKNSCPCEKRQQEGTHIIELELSPESNMTAVLDCVGILKLRNADVEHRLGVARSRKKSTKARLIFRVTLPRQDGSSYTLQTASMPILCTQPPGQPEICRMSLTESPPEGGHDLFIIGKNFLKGTHIVFIEKDTYGEDIWQAEAAIEKEYFQTTHLICAIPPYKDVDITEPVELFVSVRCVDRCGDLQPFTYIPKPKEVKPDPLLVDVTTNLSSGMSRATLEINRRFQISEGQSPFAVNVTVVSPLQRQPPPPPQTHADLPLAAATTATTVAPSDFVGMLMGDSAIQSLGGGGSAMAPLSASAMAPLSATTMAPPSAHQVAPVEHMDASSAAVGATYQLDKPPALPMDTSPAVAMETTPRPAAAALDDAAGATYRLPSVASLLPAAPSGEASVAEGRRTRRRRRRRHGATRTPAAGGC
ncbi:PREDICTED: nuclear factor of activated T-cells 5-like [Priapulus caudatus]|uniref:Nuclear factor of activated T-cells 5-like n=1 Tax=Priapulus caudatus TaxID=37621 RepID=A0ABM1F499_PRICU|nr:PREDICTED: nuclear factor of activated T-cells 5-like [Priapulus caudatus]